MAQTTTATETVELHIKNIGGITESTVELIPGVTVLAGRNATNRTSLLQAIMAALGSDDATVKGEAEEGQVKLTIGDNTYTRRLTRQNGTVTTDGDPHLEDPTLADLFAFLLETNDARQAVSRGDDLRDIIMRPVDIGEIEHQIDQYQSQREDIDRELKNFKELKQRIPKVEAQKTELQEQIKEKKSRLSEVEDNIDEVDEDLEEHQEEKDELETKLNELNEAQSQLESIRHQLESQQESFDALLDERKELESDREDYSDIPEERVEAIESEIQRLRNQKDIINRTISDLQTVIEFNEDLLNGDLDLFSDDDENHTGDITEQLVEEDNQVICWTCGNKTDTEQLESMLEKWRGLREQKMEERKSLNGQITDLKEERRQLNEEQRQRTQIETRLEDIADEISDREARIEEFKKQQNDVADQIETLELEVDDLQTENDDESELLELQKEASHLEVKVNRLETDLKSVTEELERIEERIAEQDDLKAQREEIQSEIEKLRNRVDRIEQNAVEQFNTHMEAVLDILSYDNLERIWIERTEEQVREGHQTILKGRFDLHVVRTSESGSVYEDTIDHLSESEREVTGLVFALAGYLVHNVYEVVPFMILDSIEAIDAQRLSDLINYFKDYTQHLVIALLEEDAQSLDQDYQRVSEI